MQDVFQEIKVISESFKEILERLDPKRNKNDLQDQALMMLCSRQIKFCDAFLLVAEAGFGEPSATILRAIYETYVLIRWVLTDNEKAKRYFNFSQFEGARMMDRMVSQGLMKPQDSRYPEIMKQMLKNIAELKKNKPQSFEKLAKDTGISNFHAMIYGLLSSFAHGNMLSFGLTESNKKVSFEPNQESVRYLVPMAKTIMVLSLRLYETWMTKREMCPPPEVPTYLYSVFKKKKGELQYDHRKNCTDM